MRRFPVAHSLRDFEVFTQLVLCAPGKTFVGSLSDRATKISRRLHPISCFQDQCFNGDCKWAWGVPTSFKTLVANTRSAHTLKAYSHLHVFVSQWENEDQLELQGFLCNLHSWSQNLLEITNVFTLERENFLLQFFSQVWIAHLFCFWIESFHAGLWSANLTASSTLLLVCPDSASCRLRMK